jgi:hypothetical protein
MWVLHDSSAAIQTSKWRKIITIVGLLVLSADVVLSAGYLFYEFSARVVEFSVSDTCSSVGAVFCLIGIVAASVGKGLGVRLLIPLGCFCGMLFGTLQSALAPKLVQDLQIAQLLVRVIGKVAASTHVSDFRVNQACGKTSLGHRVRKPKQHVENRDYSYMRTQFSFTYNCSDESGQSRVKSEPDAK